MAGTAGTGSRTGEDEPGPRLRGPRTGGHLARVTVSAVAALIAAQWVALHLPHPKATEPERPSRTAVEVTDATGLTSLVTGPARLAGVREREKSA